MEVYSETHGSILRNMETYVGLLGLKKETEEETKKMEMTKVSQKETDGKAETKKER